MTRGLTNRQREILEYIVRYVQDNHYPPTIAEIGERFAISSTNGVNDHLVALERKGFIERSSTKARSIRVSEGAIFQLHNDDVGRLPLVGRVAAGQPILALENIETFIPVEAALARRNAFALRVAGDSMIEAGILDGDIVAVDPNRRPNRGDIVVALVDNEATVKYFYPGGAEIELRPANAAMAPMFFPAEEVTLQGVVVMVQRRLG